MEKEFELSGKIVHYLHFGKGDKKLVCLHGYGQNAKAFLPLKTYLSRHFEVIVPNLPYHHWEDTEDVPPQKQWRFVLQQLIMANWGKGVKIHLLAFSIGGRYALSYLANYSAYVEKICFVGIDGLRSVYGFRWLNLSWPGNMLFKAFLRFPQPVFWALDAAKWWGGLSNGAHRYLRSSIEAHDNRCLLKRRWKNAAQQTYELDEVQKILKKSGVSVYFIFGKNDPFIHFETARNFCRSLPLGRWIPLDAGHNLLQPRLCEYLNEFRGC